jgi:hypothetical protein
LRCIRTSQIAQAVLPERQLSLLQMAYHEGT